MTGPDSEVADQLDLFTNAGPGKVLGYCLAYQRDDGGWHVTGTIESWERVQACLDHQRRVDSSTRWRMIEMREVSA